MEKTIQIKGVKSKVAKDAGYALFLGTGVLCVLSFLSLSVLALSKQSRSFYSELGSENEKVLSEWNNANQVNVGEAN